MKTVVSVNKKTTITTAVVPGNTTADSNTSVVATVIPKTETDSSAMPFQAPNAVAAAATNNSVKRPMSLDLNKTAKKPRLAATQAQFLPDPVGTPEIERFITNHLLETPQPGHVFPLKAGEVTTEQEEYAKGFEEALSKIHNSQTNNAAAAAAASSISTSTIATSTATVTTTGAGMSGGSFTYTNMENFPVVVKDEPQLAPGSPSVQPIDMENQELIKLERKRLRNRVAASKCRKRKLERISKLEEKVKMLKGENTDLGSVLKNLKEQVAQLKQEVIQHLDLGCSIPPLRNGNTLLSAK